MIGMAVYWPVREDHVWRFGTNQRHQPLDCGGRHLGCAIDLSGKLRGRSKNAAGALRFSGADSRRFVQSLSGDPAFATCEIDDRDAVSGSRVAGKRAAAAGLGIVGMAADADDVQWRRRGRLRRRPGPRKPGYPSSEAPRNSRREGRFSSMPDSGIRAQSILNACIGSTRLARHAGAAHASTPTATSTIPDAK